MFLRFRLHETELHESEIAKVEMPEVEKEPERVARELEMERFFPLEVRIGMILEMVISQLEAVVGMELERVNLFRLEGKGWGYAA